MSVADELKKLAELRDSGVLTEAEFQQQKARVLSGGKVAPPDAKKKGKGNLPIVLVVMAVGLGIAFLALKSWSASQWEKVGMLTSEYSLVGDIVKIAEEKTVPLLCVYTGAVAYRMAEAREAGISESIARTVVQESVLVGGEYQPRVSMALDMLPIIYREADPPEATRQKYVEECRRLDRAMQR